MSDRRVAALATTEPGAAPGKPAPRQGGRPRSEACRQRILTAATDLLEERGLRAMTIEAIAERAGTSKVTLYRWWSHKAAVVLEAMLVEVGPLPPPREAARSSVEALRWQMKSLARFLQGRNGRLLIGIVAEGVLDPEIGEAYREHWLKPRRDWARVLLAQAIDAGELVAGLDVDLTIDALFGPLYYRFLINHEPLSTAFAEAVFDTVMRGIASPRTRGDLRRTEGTATRRR